MSWAVIVASGGPRERGRVLRPSREGFKDLERLDQTSTSLARQAAADAWVATTGERSIDDALEALRDHTASVCQHADGEESVVAAYGTVAAVAMDLAEGNSG